MNIFFFALNRYTNGRWTRRNHMRIKFHWYNDPNQIKWLFCWCCYCCCYCCWWKKKYCSTYFCCIYLSVDTNKCHVYPCFAAIQPLACCRPFARYIFIEWPFWYATLTAILLRAVIHLPRAHRELAYKSGTKEREKETTTTLYQRIWWERHFATMALI